MTTETTAPHPIPGSEPQCGQPITMANGKVKPCVKPAGHKPESAHSSRIVKVKAARKPASKDVLKSLKDLEASADVEYGSKGRTVEPDELDLGLREAVAEAHTKWLSAGKPDGFDAMRKAKVVRRFLIELDEEDDMRARLRNAADFNKVSVKIAKPVAHTTGKYLLAWGAVDTIHRQPATTAAS